jgi:chromosomal replication initiation ATPase DnaA
MSGFFYLDMCDFFRIFVKEIFKQKTMQVMTESEMERFLNEMADVDVNEPIRIERMMKFDNQKFTQWAVHSGGKFTPALSTTQTLDSGFYEIGHDSQMGTYMEKKEVSADELYHLPSNELVDIIEDIEKFWNRRDKYEQYNFIHKRGILLYGQPGCGKSAIIQLCTKHLIDNMNGIVINITNGDQVEYYSKMIGKLRQVEPNRPLVVIFEDIDAIASEGNWTTSMILNLLDGIKQIQNVVYIATTNHPEKLEDRITNRPSRFDRRYEVELPNEEVRKSYIQNKLSEDDLKGINMDEWIKESEGFSLAHMRELVISVITMDNSFEDTIARLKGMKVKPKIKSNTSGIGFAFNK